MEKGAKSCGGFSNNALPHFFETRAVKKFHSVNTWNVICDRYINFLVFEIKQAWKKVMMENLPAVRDFQQNAIRSFELKSLKDHRAI